MHSVLVYHTIDEVKGQPACPEMISPARFEQQLAWLSRRRRVTPLIETLSNQTSLVALTFDDGYRDNFTAALPLLEKYSMPATIFMVAGFVGRDGYLSPAELREISKHPLVTIGSHGLWHRNFNAISETEARLELIESRRELESIIDQKVTLMAWPYGECNSHLEQLSAECGYAASWSVWRGSNGRYSRWRVPLGARDNMVRFVAKVSGVYALTEAKLHRYRAMSADIPVGGSQLSSLHLGKSPAGMPVDRSQERLRSAESE